MPSDWAIKKVLELRQRQMDMQGRAGLRDKTGNAFDALIGEALDEAWYEGSRQGAEPAKERP